MKSARWMALAALGMVLVAGCGDTNPTDVSGDTAGTTVASSVGGLIQGSDSGATAFVVPNRSTLWALDNPLDHLFGLPLAEATACGPANESCTAGVVTHTFNSCTSKNGRITYTGGFTLTLGGAVTACPGSGFWKNFATTVNATLFKTFTAGSAVTNASGVSVTFNNTNPTGWDTAVTLTKNSTYNAFGMLRKTVTVPSSTPTTFSSTQNLFNSGMQHVATGTSKKGNAVTVWDHTISMTGNGMNVTHTFDSGAGTDTKVVTSADANSKVVVQHNKAKWTGTSSLNNVTYVHGTNSYCGCFPTSGTINVTYNGSKSGSEQMTFNYATTNVCGSYTLQPCSDSTCTTLTGTATSGTLAHCL